jgi:hypothetical protein
VNGDELLTDTPYSKTNFPHDELLRDSSESSLIYTASTSRLPLLSKSAKAPALSGLNSQAAVAQMSPNIRTDARPEGTVRTKGEIFIFGYLVEAGQNNSTMITVVSQFGTPVRP